MQGRDAKGLTIVVGIAFTYYRSRGRTQRTPMEAREWGGRGKRGNGGRGGGEGGNTGKYQAVGGAGHERLPH